MRTSSDKRHEVRDFIPLVRDLKEGISLVLADKTEQSTGFTQTGNLE